MEWSIPKPIINATGVVLHTNLGRAPLSIEAAQAGINLSGYSDLEYDLQAGERGSRYRRVENLLRVLTGAESAHVTVNNASAVLLALTALTSGQEVVISRGQAVEIGGGFRVPEILDQSGARLVEVGTTNRTRPDDYDSAITDRTAAILYVHSSNFRIIGFTQEVSLTELSEIAHHRSVPLIVDNGSGSMIDTAQFGLAHEPMPSEAIAAGADLVAFSADKLLGGPQAGLLIGRRPLVEQIGAHPLARAVRADKMTLAMLTATLLAYIRGDATRTLPLWRMIALSSEDMVRRAHDWQVRSVDAGFSVDVTPGESTIGGGSLPAESLPTALIVLPAGVTARDLRACEPPVIGRTRDDRVVLDLRTVMPDQEDTLFRAVRGAVLGRSKNSVIDSATP